MNEQNGLNQNTQNNSNVISADSLNMQPQPLESIEPLPLPESVTQQIPVVQEQEVAPTPAPQVVSNGEQVPNTTTTASAIQEQPTISQNSEESLPIPPTVLGNTEPVREIKKAETKADIIQAVPDISDSQDITPKDVINPLLDSNVTPVNQTVDQNIPNFGNVDTTNNVSSPQVPNQNVGGPSVPLMNGSDATQVGFIAASSAMPKKKNVPLIVTVVILVLGVLGTLGYFVIYPFIIKTFFSDPIMVYEATIDGLYKEISATAEDLLHTKAIYEANVSIESNLEDLKKFSGFSYGINIGVDPDKELIQMGYEIRNLSNDNEYSFYDYVKDGKEYLKYSNNRGYIYNGTVDLKEQSQFFTSYKELIEKSNNLNNEEIGYLINKLNELTKGSILIDKLSKEDTTININGETVKVTNNKYEMDYDVVKHTKDYIIDGIKDDDKSIDILKKILDIEDTSEIKDILNEIKDSISTKKDVIYTVSIYTYGNKNEVMGFGIISSDDSIELQYYKKDNYFELNAKTSVDDEKTGKTNEQTLDIIGKIDGDTTNISVKYNTFEVLSLVITKWSKEEKELSYNLKYDEYKIKGKISSNYDINDDRIKYSFSIDANTGNEFVKLKINLNEDWTSSVANINTDNAVTLTDEQLDAIKNEYNKLLMETPIGSLFTTINGEYSPGISDYYDNANQGDIENFEPAIENEIDDTI